MKDKPALTWEMVEARYRKDCESQKPWIPQPMPFGHIKRIKEKIGNWEELKMMYPQYARAIANGEL